MGERLNAAFCSIWQHHSAERCNRQCGGELRRDAHAPAGDRLRQQDEIILAHDPIAFRVIDEAAIPGVAEIVEVVRLDASLADCIDTRADGGQSDLPLRSLRLQTYG